MKNIIKIICGSLAIFAAAVIVSPVTAALPEFCMDGQRITLNADNTPLWRLLRALARYKVRVQADPEMNPRITLRLENVPVEIAVRRMLGDINHIMIWEKEKTTHRLRLAELQIFEPGYKHRMQRLPRSDTFDIVKNRKDGSLYIRGELLMRKPESMRDRQFVALIHKLGGDILEADKAIGVYRVKFPEETDIPGLAALIREKGGQFGTAEPNYAYPVLMPHRGPVTEAKSLPATEIPKGAARVAVLDSGVMPGSGIDESVVAAFDAVQPDFPISDFQGHGTQMAMIASGSVYPMGAGQSEAATTPVIAIRAFDDNGYTSNFSMMRSINFAVENGARVLSMSWGSETASRFMKDALDYAASKDLILLAAAGNKPTGKPVYPAAYDTVIGVGALAPDGKRWDQSNYGKFVRILAPGYAELPVGYEGNPGIYAGTSIATAYAANAVAKYLTEHPDASGNEIYRMLDEKF